jgi:hypothetical protein
MEVLPLIVNDEYIAICQVKGLSSIANALWTADSFDENPQEYGKTLSLFLETKPIIQLTMTNVSRLFQFPRIYHYLGNCEVLWNQIPENYKKITIERIKNLFRQQQQCIITEEVAHSISCACIADIRLIVETNFIKFLPSNKIIENFCHVSYNPIMKNYVLNLFCSSPSYADHRLRFELLKPHMTNLTENDYVQLVTALAKNDQLYERDEYIYGHHLVHLVLDCDKDVIDRAMTYVAHTIWRIVEKGEILTFPYSNYFLVECAFKAKQEELYYFTSLKNLGNKNEQQMGLFAEYQSCLSKQSV